MQVKLSKKQKEMLKEKCPECKTGNLHEVEGVGTENYLFCNNCDCSVDCSGNWIC